MRFLEHDGFEAQVVGVVQGLMKPTSPPPFYVLNEKGMPYSFDPRVWTTDPAIFSALRLDIDPIAAQLKDKKMKLSLLINSPGGSKRVETAVREKMSHIQRNGGVVDVYTVQEAYSAGARIVSLADRWFTAPRVIIGAHKAVHEDVERAAQIFSAETLEDMDREAQASLDSWMNGWEDDANASKVDQVRARRESAFNTLREGDFVGSAETFAQWGIVDGYFNSAVELQRQFIRNTGWVGPSLKETADMTLGKMHYEYPIADFLAHAILSELREIL